MLRLIRRRSVIAYWALVGIFFSVMQIANAQDGTVAPPEHHHVKRYIALAILVIGVVGFLAYRSVSAKNAEEQKSAD